jgi:hypothetical protein
MKEKLLLWLRQTTGILLAVLFFALAVNIVAQTEGLIGGERPNGAATTDRPR